MFIQKGRIGLRPIEEGDLDLLRDWRNDPKVREPFREFRPLNMVNQKRWFDSLDDRTIMFAIWLNEPRPGWTEYWTPKGVCGLTTIDWHNRSAELSAYIGDPIGESYLPQAIDLLIDYGFDELGLHRIHAERYIGLADPGHELELHGFKHEGIRRQVLWRHGQWWDSEIMSRLEGEVVYSSNDGSFGLDPA